MGAVDTGLNLVLEFNALICCDPCWRSIKLEVQSLLNNGTSHLLPCESCALNRDDTSRSQCSRLTIVLTEKHGENNYSHHSARVRVCSLAHLVRLSSTTVRMATRGHKAAYASLELIFYSMQYDLAHNKNNLRKRLSSTVIVPSSLVN